MVKRVRLSFAKGLEVEFSDRDRAIKQVYELGEKGTRYPMVVFGPEGCGKTSWLLQAVEILKELKFDVVYFNPLRRRFDVDVGIEGLKQKALEIIKQVAAEHELARLVWLVIDFANEALKHRRRKLAIIVDDVFHLIGSREAAAIVKGLLEVIEHPIESYENIVAIVATSEGLSKREIGRHRWGWLTPMWNMSKKGFEELYERLSRPKPSFEEIWNLAGGNPETLQRLYQANWNVKVVVEELARRKELSREFVGRWRKWLEAAVEEIDVVDEADFPSELREELIKRNLIVYDLFDRDPVFWIDVPPPEKELEIGVGRYVAWQTPLHREAVKSVLEKHSSPHTYQP